MSIQNRAFCIILLLWLSIWPLSQVQAAIFPVEGARLNYRLVGFSFPRDKKATRYKVQIASGIFKDQARFVPDVESDVSTQNRIISEVQSFGADYTWRIVYDPGTSSERKSILYHFSTGTLPPIGSGAPRLRILKQEAKNSNLNSYVMLNGSRTLYDMKGNPVWFVPNIEKTNSSASDIKFTPQHTLSLLYNNNAYEVNYNGEILWKAPLPGDVIKGSKGSEGGSIIYHHEFTRLQNGNYMALGSMQGSVSQPASEPGRKDGSDAGKKERYHFFPSTLSSVIYEFDEAGKIVWSWNTQNYMDQSDIKTYLSDNFPGMPIDAHENSFYFDQAFKIIYLSLCSFNRVIAINYPSGKVINTYGTIYKAGSGSKEQNKMQAFRMGFQLPNGLFCGQHNCSKFTDGNIYLYNNQLCDSGSVPQVLALRTTEAGSNVLQKVWQLDCTTDDFKGPNQGGGGSVKEMDNGSVFVMMNGPYSKTFIVNKNKEVLWSAICEMKNETSGDWTIAPSYRASIINRADLEKIIWNSKPNAAK